MFFPKNYLAYWYVLNYTYHFLSKPDLNDQKRTKNTLYLYVFIYLVQETDIEEKDAKQSQMNKTEHGLERA